MVAQRKEDIENDYHWISSWILRYLNFRYNHIRFLNWIMVEMQLSIDFGRSSRFWQVNEFNICFTQHGELWNGIRFIFIKHNARIPQKADYKKLWKSTHISRYYFATKSSRLDFGYNVWWNKLASTRSVPVLENSWIHQISNWKPSLLWSSYENNLLTLKTCICWNL